MASIRQNYTSKRLKRTVFFFSLAAVLLGFLAIQGVQSTQASSTRVTDTQLVQATEHFVDQLAAEDKFSGALLIANQNEPIFKKAYGLASKGYNVPNQVDTKFNLGSMNKMFTLRCHRSVSVTRQTIL